MKIIGKQRKTRLFVTLAAFMTLPVMILGIVLVIMTNHNIKSDMENNIRGSLAGVARECLYTFENRYEGDMYFANGKYYIGDTILSEEYDFVDRIKENTGYDVTVFYGATRVLTTISGKNGTRLTGTQQRDTDVINTVFDGRDYFSDEVLVLEQPYYGYYLPLYNSGKTVCGMLFVGVSNESVVDSAENISRNITIIVLAALVVIVALSAFFAGGIVKALNEIKNYIGELAELNFEKEIPEKILNRKDEIGDLGRYSVDVGVVLKGMIANDPLTGLYNRRVGRTELEKLMKKSAGVSDAQKSVCVALGDIDFFKKVNDTYGHNYGDRVLVKVAQLCNSVLEEKGFAIRWGGEEFLLVYKGSHEDCMKTMETLMDEIRNTVFAFGESSFQITMTFGVLQWDGKTDVQELISQADAYLYKGKNNGRNQLVTE